MERVSLIGPSASEEGLERFMRIEAASWKGPRGEGTSICNLPEAETFYRAVLANFEETDDARVDLLQIAGAPAAALLAVRCGSTWSLLKIGFDQSFSRYGPGNILLKLFIEEMAETPDVTEVSLVTAPHWAARWHMRTEATFNLRIFAGSPLGQAMAVGHHAMASARRFKAGMGSRR